MKIICFGCGKGMGDADVEPTDEIKFCYGLHEECQSTLKFKSDLKVFNEHVKKQSSLKKKGDASGSGGVAPSV